MEKKEYTEMEGTFPEKNKTCMLLGALPESFQRDLSTLMMANPNYYKSFTQLKGAACSLHERDVSFKLINKEEKKEEKKKKKKKEKKKEKKEKKKKEKKMEEFSIDTTLYRKQQEGDDRDQRKGGGYDKKKKEREERRPLG